MALAPDGHEYASCGRAGKEMKRTRLWTVSRFRISVQPHGAGLQQLRHFPATITSRVFSHPSPVPYRTVCPAYVPAEESSRQLYRLR